MIPDDINPPPPATIPNPGDTKTTLTNPGQAEQDSLPRDKGGEAGSTSGREDFVPPEPSEETAGRAGAGTDPGDDDKPGGNAENEG